jgi:cation transport ATPase
MGATPSGPAPLVRPERLFPYSSPEPWTWIPGTWILPGTVFVTSEGEFYRFVKRTDDGWKAEEVEPSAVGNPSRIADIARIRLEYERTLAAHDELDQKMRDGADTPEGRALLRERDRELHRLRDRLILLCNGSSSEARAAASQPDRWKWAMVILLAVAFVVAVASCIRRLFAFVPEQAGGMIAGAAFFLSGAALFVIGARELAKHKNRLVTGNLVGCYTLFILAVVVAAFGVMLLSVYLLYTGAYGGL